MNDLLKLAIEAHGGLEKWNQFKQVRIHMLVGGMLWAAKGQGDVISDSYFETNLREQYSRYPDFERAGQEAVAQPGRVAIIYKGNIADELLNPRDSFVDHTITTQWSKLQLVYFGSYAMWCYLTIPFSFTLPGFETKEIEPWHEAGETWRRLQVTFPDHLAYHSRVQVFYFDQAGLLKRHDYETEVSGGFAAAHYVFDYKEFQGIKLPTRRMVYPRDEQQRYIPEPLVVQIDLLDVTFS